MSGLEIEKKFLVRNHSYQTQNSGQSHIQQGYICSDRGRTVRVRIRDDRGYLTIKGPSSDNGLSRYEFEKEIDPDEAQELMKLCEKSEETGKPLMIDKTRYLVKSGRHTFEVDEFHGENEGLVVAEVELHSEDEDYLLQLAASEAPFQHLAERRRISSPITAASVTPVASAAKSSQSPLRWPPVQYSCNNSMTPPMIIGISHPQKNNFS